MYIHVYRSLWTLLCGLFVYGGHAFVVCDMSHQCVTQRIYAWCPRGWLRLVRSLKSQVSFAEYCLFDRALLQKRPIIFRSLLIVATPYVCDMASCHVSWLIDIWREANTSANSTIGCKCTGPLFHMGQVCLICDMSHWYLCDMTWHDAFIRDMTPWYVAWLMDVWYDTLTSDMSFSNLTRLFRVWQDSFAYEGLWGGYG